MKKLMLSAALMLAAMSIVAFSSGAAVTASGKDNQTQAYPAGESSGSTLAETQPVDLAYLTKQKLVQPLYVGATPAPAKNGPFGLVKSVPLNQASTEPSPQVQWFDTEEQLQAALNSLP